MRQSAQMVLKQQLHGPVFQDLGLIPSAARNDMGLYSFLMEGQRMHSLQKGFRWK